MPLIIGKLPIILNIEKAISYTMKIVYVENREEEFYWRMAGELLGGAIMCSVILIALCFTG